MPSSNDEEDSDPMPALQERGRDNSNSDDDNAEDHSDLGRNSNKDRFEKSETWKERSQSTSIPKWKGNETNTNNVYGGDNEEK